MHAPQDRHIVWNLDGSMPWRFMALFWSPQRNTDLRTEGLSGTIPALSILSCWSSLGMRSMGVTFMRQSLSSIMSTSWSFSPRPYTTSQASFPRL